jgi:hypothetical protein
VPQEFLLPCLRQGNNGQFPLKTEDDKMLLSAICIRLTFLPLILTVETIF